MSIVLAVLLLSPVRQEPDWKAVEVKPEKVAGNVYMLASGRWPTGLPWPPIATCW